MNERHGLELVSDSSRSVRSARCAGARLRTRPNCSSACRSSAGLSKRALDRGREDRGRDRPRRRQGADPRGRAGPAVLRPARRQGRGAPQGPEGQHDGGRRLLRRDLARHRAADHGDGDAHRAVDGARHLAAGVPADAALAAGRPAAGARSARPSAFSVSTRASSGARGARARARRAGRAAPRTGFPTPRRASRRRSSP